MKPSTGSAPGRHAAAPRGPLELADALAGDEGALEVRIDALGLVVTSAAHGRVALSHREFDWLVGAVARYRALAGSAIPG